MILIFSISLDLNSCAKVKSALNKNTSVLSAVSGGGQSLEIGGTRSKPLKLSLMSNGSPVVGEIVTFAVTVGESVESPVKVATTDSKGIASIEAQTTSIAGDSIVSATWQDQIIEFQLTAVDSSKQDLDDSEDDLLLLAGGGQSADPNTTFSQPVKVTAIRKGVPIAGERVTFSQVSGSMAIVIANSTVKTDANGEASTAVAAGSVVGSATIRATWKKRSVDATMTIARDEHINIVDGNLQTAAPGQSFSSPLKVQVVRSGAPVVGAAITFAVQSGAGVTLSSPTVVTDASGLAQTNATAGATAGSTVIRASYNGLTTDFSITTIAQSTTTIGYVSGNGQTGAPNSSASSSLVVEVRNSSTTALMENVLVRFSVTTGNGKVNTTLTTYDVSTNSLGQASTSFKFGTLAGVNTIEAKIVGNPSQTHNFSATTVVSSSATVDLATSNMSASQSSLTANGVSQSTITLTVRDQYGNQIPLGSGTVVFTPTAGSMSGSVINNGNGTWSQILIAPSSKGAGFLTVSATFNGSALTSTALNITLVSGGISAPNSTIAVDQSSITANGTSTATVTVSLRDANGNVVGTGGETVVITVTGGTLLGSVVDVGNGTYSQVIKSTTLAQTVSLTATVGGIAVGSGPAVASLIFAPGTFDITKTTIGVSPSSIIPNASSTSTVTVTLRDANSNQLTAGGRTVVISSTAGTWNTAVVDNTNGTYQKVLRSAASEATATVSATVDGVAVPTTAKVYMTSGDGGPSIYTSLISIVGGTTHVAADNSTTATVRVTLYDKTGVAMTSGGSTVVIASTAGTLLGSVLDNANGTYTQLIRAPAASAIATLTATVDGLQLNSTKTLNFYGSMSTATSTIAAYPPSAVANGISTSLIVIQAKDSSSIDIPVGGATGLVLSSTSGTLQASIVDNGNGTYTQSLLSPASAANATVTATKSAVAFTNSTIVTFFTSTNRAGLIIDCANIGTYTGQNILVDNGTLTMNSYGTASSGADCAASFTFGAIILTNSGIITHSATSSATASTGQEYRLELSATSISIDGTSRIDVSGKGYVHLTTDTGYRTQGNTNTASVPYYGSVFYPADLGPSGSLQSSGNIGSAGGGRLKITMLNGGSIVNNGAIKADGASYAQSQGGSGWGGSIQINVGELSGTGTITANGGAATAGGAPYSSGNGGRIAIYYTSVINNFSTPINVVAYVNACGGTNTASGYSGHAGTVFIKKSTQTYGDLILNNCSRNTLSNTSRTQINSPSNAIPSALSATVLTKSSAFGDVFDTSKNPYVGWYINPNIDQNATASRLDDVSYLITSGTSSTATITTGNMLSIADVSKTYQFMIKVDNLEIAGGASISSSAPIVSVSGDLRSNDSNTVSVAGYIPTEVEYSGVNSYVFDGTNSYNPASNISFSNFGTAAVTLKNSTYTSGAITASSLIIDGATLVPSCVKGTACITLSGALTLQNTATLAQKATSLTTEYSMEITASTLNLANGSTISANGRGYVYNNAAVAAAYVSNANTITTNSTGAGGSHGGKGGNSNNAGYGSMTSPATSGSSGAVGNSQLGSAGGGIVRLNISGTTTLDGVIDANGSSHVSWGGGGAGGSIYISTNSVTGGGTIRTSGGSSTIGSGGGGGRIALIYTTASGGFTYPTSILSRFQAYGATGISNQNGSAGTVYLKSAAQTYGDLYINNNNTTPQSGYNTYINIPSPVASTSLTSSLLTNTSAFLESSLLTNHLLGFSINPNTAQNSTATFNDETTYVVTSQTANTLTTAGNMTSVGSAGNTYQVMLVLDNLEVSGKAVLEATGPVLVKNGDISSNTTDTVTSTGGMIGTGTTASFEFASLASGTLNAGTSTINLNLLNASGAVTFINGTFTSNLVTSSALTLDAATLTMGCLKSASCITLSGALTLQNTSTLIQKATSLTAEYGMEISASTLNLATGSTISANSRGYVHNNAGVAGGFVTNGNTSGSTSTGGGGSHGGRGGNSGISTYGSLASPNTSGSSGANWSSIGGAGGGIIRLYVSGTATVDGIIDANGSVAANGNTGSGAGGSIYFSANTVTGGGTIRANGAASSSGSGGGGGRIALYYTTASGGFTYPTNILSRFQAYGNTGTTGQNGSAGTVYLKSATQTYGDLYINNNGTTPQSGYTTYINIPSPSASSGLTATTLTNSSAFTESSLLTNHLVGFSVNPNTAQNSTAVLSDDTAFVITSQTANVLTTSVGDMTSIGSSGNSYQVMLILDNLEISGSGVLLASGPVLVQSGDISSNTTNTVNMTGTASSTGATAAIEYSGTLVSATFNANGGSQVFTRLNSSGTVNLQNGTFTIPTMTIGGDLNLSSSATVNSGSTGFAPNVVVTGDLNLTGTSSLKSRVTTATTEYRLYVTAANINIGSGSSVNAVNAGYGQQVNYSVRSVGNTNVSTDGLKGGTYGGQGGLYNGGSTNTAYGYFNAPTDLGTSGSVYVADPTNPVYGGGAVRLTVPGTLTVDGTVSANSLNSCGASLGGGSGGSVYINTGTLTGGGLITANGSTCQYSGGGGGRIAVYYTSRTGSFAGATVYSSINAFGGAGMGGNIAHAGGAGTIYLKSAAQTYGDLIINNNNTTSNSGLTSLPIPTLSTSGTVTSTVLTASAFGNAYGLANQFLGFYFNPNTAQNGTLALMNDLFFPVLSNTTGAITISSGDLTSVASSGNTFKAVLYLDNLEIRGKGKLDFAGQQIVARDGDVSSNNTTSFVLDGTLNVGIIDVNTAAWSTTANAAGTITTKCASNFACP